MTATCLDMATELVIQQIQISQLDGDGMRALLADTHATLVSLSQEGDVGQAAASAAAGSPVDWKQSISKYSIQCLECGDSMRQLMSRHLAKHGLTPRSYRQKYGIPHQQPLSAREATARRRALAHRIRPWEQTSQVNTKPARRGKAKAKAKGAQG